MHDKKFKFQLYARGPVSKPPQPGTGPRPIVWVALIYKIAINGCDKPIISLSDLVLATSIVKLSIIS